jgi:hypothetical protein
MCYRIAGIDVHKKMLAVVVSDVEIESEFIFPLYRRVVCVTWFETQRAHASGYRASVNSLWSGRSWDSATKQEPTEGIVCESV